MSARWTTSVLAVAVAHGQMAAGQLEDVMTAFYEGKFDILLATTIVMLDARHDVERLAAAVALAQERLADGERIERRHEGG
jgi:RecG-like helicase